MRKLLVITYFDEEIIYVNNFMFDNINEANELIIISTFCFLRIGNYSCNIKKYIDCNTNILTNKMIVIFMRNYFVQCSYVLEKIIEI